VAKSFESKASEGKGGFLELWKRFNKVSAFVLAAGGVVLGEPALLAWAGIDVAQNYLINRFQEWRAKSKAKGLGKIAVGGSKAQPAPA